ncbi:MAG: uroporphyrinogen-III synthase [Flavobacterium sp.]
MFNKYKLHLKTILSTKILDIELKKNLHQNNFKVIEHDFITIKFIDNLIPFIENQVIITSKNAIQALENYSKELLKIFCVGFETQRILQEKGFNVIETAKNGQSLAEIIVKKYSNLNFTYFCSEIRRDILPNILNQNYIQYQEIIAYKTILTPLKIVDKVDFIFFYSPSGVKSFLINNLITNELCVCIGKTTAHELDLITQNVIISSSSVIKDLVFEFMSNF